MGGIAGMIRFDGNAVSFKDITQIENHLKHRGKVTSQVNEQGILWVFGGSIEADNTADVFATTDADIFNTSEHQGFITNYLHKGSLSFNKLNADFAVALWDTRRQSIVCARDILGVKPLYYVHRPGRFFAFASELKALIAIEDVAVIPNPHKFREYLTWTTEYVPYSSETFYEHIYSILPGHYLEVKAHEVRLLPFWKPNLDRFSKLSDAEDYSIVFKDRFTAAIDARMKAKNRVGAHLSGGLDSSSVSCVAQQLLNRQNRPSLHTFTIDTGLASTDESEYVKAVVNQHHTEHHTVFPVTDVLDSILKINNLFDRPEHFIIPSSFHLSVSVKAQQLGCDCLLTGHDGDSVATTGFEYLDQLIDNEDWEELRLACQQFVSFPTRNLSYLHDHWSSLNDQSKFEKYTLYIIGAEVKKRFKSMPFHTFLKTIQAQKQLLGLSTSAIVTYCVQRIYNKITHKNGIDNALNPDFKQRITPRPQQTTKELTEGISLEYDVSVNQILNTTNVICNEQLNHIGAYYGHQYSFPFFDKQVIELGLSTPLKISYDHGRGRGLIRNGLQTILPPVIVSRLSKVNFVEYGNLSAQQLYLSTHELFMPPGHAIWGIIDRVIFSKIVEIVFNPPLPMQRKTRYNWLLSRIIYLALWLSSLPTRKS
ncbi:asparagine synthetase B [Runella sp.]|jgi:asparagine synthase (glutamine-hydrolysing)|uniref:asparagine synthetase B family protein n=1 Tax=Runella sp. TaxID=1960881 RepID=UPI00261A3A87|nr:asparagine synthase-related protein [Runella sp.]